MGSCWAQRPVCSPCCRAAGLPVPTVASAQARVPCSSRPSGSSLRTGGHRAPGRPHSRWLRSEQDGTPPRAVYTRVERRDDTEWRMSCDVDDGGAAPGAGGGRRGLLSRHLSEARVSRRAAPRRCESRAAPAEDGHEGRVAGPGRENVGVEEAGEGWGASGEPAGAGKLPSDEGRPLLRALPQVFTAVSRP